MPRHLRLSPLRHKTILLANVLLKRHKERRRQHPSPSSLDIQHFTIPYAELCRQASLPGLERRCGVYLREIAEWCRINEFPPLNGLAVRGNTRPGGSYDGAGGFRLLDWQKDVLLCIRFDEYPTFLRECPEVCEYCNRGCNYTGPMHERHRCKRHHNA